MSVIVLDSSAILALLHGEPGSSLAAAALLEGAAMSVVNLSEVVARLVEDSLGESEIRAVLDGFDLELFDFNRDDGLTAGLLRSRTRPQGLSFGDRACVALAARVGLPVLTGDRRWADIDPTLGIEVRLIR